MVERDRKAEHPNNLSVNLTWKFVLGISSDHLNIINIELQFELGIFLFIYMKFRWIR